MNKKVLISILVTLVLSLIIYYFTLPPLNPSAISFWLYIVTILAIYYIISTFINVSVPSRISFVKNRMNIDFKLGKLIFVIPAIFIIILIVNLICSPIFNANSYANRIEVLENKDFTKDIPEVDFNMIPLLDKESSQKLGDRTMGSMTDLVSQFYVSDLYTQINYNNDIIRVTPLEYADMIKYFTNRGEGIKGYITVNSVNGEAKLVRLEKGMKYMPSAMFFENLNRKLRISYPTKIFGAKSFEIDNEGNPYWIVETLSYKGIGLREEVNGVIVLNPITGSSKWYSVKDVPKWIDHVYNAELIIDQFDNWGEYKIGFFNSIFGQKGVVNTTEGYNYLAMNDDIYLYTGVTSVSSDESNLGFILTNMRTKETHMYSIAGAEEFSAMASAEGVVQDKKYRATFPLLINLNNRPTYLMSLKDNAGLVKMYAFVDVVDYQKVTTSDSSLGIEEAARLYLNDAPSDTTTNLEEEMQIKNITSAVIDGVTYYYLTDSNDNRYSVSIKVNKNLLPFLKSNDVVKVKYKNNNQIRTITEINVKN